MSTGGRSARAGLAGGVDSFSGLVDVVKARVPSEFALVRPDGVLVARGSREQLGEVFGYLRRISSAIPSVSTR